MRAKDIFLDFLNLLFLIFLIISSLVYFILGDNFEQVIKIMKALTPLSFFGLLIAFKLRMNKKRKNKKEREGNLTMELWFCYGDKAKSEYFLYSLPLVLLIIPVIRGHLPEITDILKALAVFGGGLWWHRHLFITKGESQKNGISVYMSYIDKIKGDVVIFFFPVIVILISAVFSVVGIMDLVQAALVLILGILWQQFLLSKEV